MSARGARSRKVQQKDIVKNEKVIGKGKAPEAIYEAHDAFAEWRPSPSIRNLRSGLSRSITVSSDNNRATSRSSSTHEGSGNRARLNTLQSNDSSELRHHRQPESTGRGPSSLSDVSSKGREKTKFQSKGKETKAPRGRGGGVPIKKTTASSPTPPLFRAASVASSLSPNQKTWMNFKVWERGRESLRPYGGFDVVRFYEVLSGSVD